MADDLLQGLRDVVGNNHPEGGDMDNPQAAMEQFLKALENMPGMEDADKEDLIKGLLQGGLGGGQEFPIGGPITNPWLEFVVLFGLIGVVILLLGYIGYRLYNSMTQREKRKELKRLQKDQKKNK